MISRNIIFFENEYSNNDSNSTDDLNLVYSLPENQSVSNSGGEIQSDESVTDDNEFDTSIYGSPAANSSSSNAENLFNNDNVGDENTLVNVLNDRNDYKDEESFLDDTLHDPTFTTRARIEPTDRAETRGFPLSLMNLHVAFMTFMIVEPRTYKQAIECEDSSKWIEAMKDEYESLIKNDTWKLVNRPKNRNVIDNRWVYRIKRNTDDSVERYKARLVARGFSQEYGYDYLETFSPVVRFTSIRMILAIAASRKMKLKQFDVKTAFLNGELRETIFMEQPSGFSDGTNRVCQLQRSLYGLKQASRCWNQKFKTFIQLFGFTISKADSCVFISKRSGKLTIMAIHVDDGLVANKDDECWLFFWT